MTKHSNKITTINYRNMSMIHSSTSISCNDMEMLFGLRARMLLSNHDLAIVYGAYLEAARTRPHKVTEDGRIILDNMREVLSRTGLGRSTGTIANLTRRLETLGLLKIISMTKDNKDSMFMVLTRSFFSELPQSFLSERDFLGATNKVATQPLLSEEYNSTPFFLSEERLTQSVLKESLILIYREVIEDKELIDISKDIVTNNRYFYSSTYSLLWGRSESLLGYQRLNLKQKVVLELICTYEFDVDSLARYLGMRKNNLKSRILKPLGEYVRIENGVITPRENLLEVMEGGFDRERFDNIQRTIKDRRIERREQQREHMAEGDRKLYEFLWDFLDGRRERKAARAAAEEAASDREVTNHTKHGQYRYASDGVTIEETTAASDSPDPSEYAGDSESEVRETVEFKPKRATAEGINDGFSGQLVKVPLDEDGFSKGRATENAARAEAFVSESLGDHFCCGCGAKFTATRESTFYEWWACDDCIGALRDHDEERTHRQKTGFTTRQAPPEPSTLLTAVPLAEQEAVIQDENAEDESSFDMVCKDIDKLGFKAWGTSVMKEVARVLLDEPDILAPRSERVRFDGIRAGTNALALTDSDIERALTELRGTCLNVLLYHYGPSYT